MAAETWWDDADQALADRRVLLRRDLGRGWVDAPMVNNEPRLDPHGDDDASQVLRTEREARRLTGLNEGRAWRRRRESSVLMVVRHEVFANPDHEAHRDAWQRVGAASLDATWRTRWRERDVANAWIEARMVPGDQGPLAGLDDVDWLQVEDHTNPLGGIDVSIYEHISVWSGRCLVTLTLRHPHGLDMDDIVASATRAVRRRIPIT